MRLSSRVEYACLALVALARHGSAARRLHARAIAEEYQIPETYLAQILLQLKAAGLIYSTRGTRGGYRLSRPAESITLHEVFSAIEGPEVQPRETQRLAASILAQVMEHLRAAERAVLGQVTMAHLAEGAAPQEWVI